MLKYCSIVWPWSGLTNDPYSFWFLFLGCQSLRLFSWVSGSAQWSGLYLFDYQAWCFMVRFRAQSAFTSMCVCVCVAVWQHCLLNTFQHWSVHFMIMFLDSDPCFLLFFIILFYTFCKHGSCGAIVDRTVTSQHESWVQAVVQVIVLPSVCVGFSGCSGSFP